MKKCLKIMLMGTFPANFFIDIVQKNAKKLDLEGSAQMVGGTTLRIVVCGSKESVDSLLDLLHKNLNDYGLCELEIEPFIKDKDYRGVFRVIE